MRRAGIARPRAWSCSGTLGSLVGQRRARHGPCRSRRRGRADQAERDDIPAEAGILDLLEWSLISSSVTGAGRWCGQANKSCYARAGAQIEMPDFRAFFRSFPLLFQSPQPRSWPVGGRRPGRRRDIGKVDVDGRHPDDPGAGLRQHPGAEHLAQLAFRSHGRYRLVASGYAYDIRFSLAAPDKVRVDIARGAAAAPAASAIVPGTSDRNALLRAADCRGRATNGLGLRGYFASRLVFIGRATRAQGGVRQRPVLRRGAADHRRPGRSR